jgi:hypothetical protein
MSVKDVQFQERNVQSLCPICKKGHVEFYGHKRITNRDDNRITLYSVLLCHCNLCNRDFGERYKYDRSFFVPTEEEIEENNHILLQNYNSR